MKNADDRNIILVGMPGAGKSTLGVLLAKALGMDFVDADIVIQQREGRLLQQIIDQEGNERFLQAEEAALCQLDVKRAVVATGGSAVYSDRAMKALGQNGLIVYLKVTFEEIDRRIPNLKTRGVVMRSGGGLREAYAERAPLYEKYCDVCVDCTDGSVAQCLDELMRVCR